MSRLGLLPKFLWKFSAWRISTVFKWSGGETLGRVRQHHSRAHINLSIRRENRKRFRGLFNFLVKPNGPDNRRVGATKVDTSKFFLGFTDDQITLAYSGGSDNIRESQSSLWRLWSDFDPDPDGKPSLFTVSAWRNGGQQALKISRQDTPFFLPCATFEFEYMPK